VNPDVELPSDSIPAETARLLTPQSVRRAGLFSIPILALLPLLLYITAGYGGHDFKYHATAWLELHDAWSAHEWRFGWSPWAHYGFGEPSFCFYPPLSLVIGAGLSFLMPFRFVPGVVVWLLLITSGLSMYKAAGLFVPQQYRLPAALLYMFNPYLLMTVVIRFAIAEAWSQALLPLVFLYFYVLIAENRLPVLLVSASLLAAGWLSNISAAIGIFYGFGFLAILIAIQRRSIRPLLLAALTQLCGILLAAFRLLPTFAEKSWVSSQSLLIYDFRSFMQLKRVPPPHLMVYLAGVYIALSLALMFPAVRGIVRRDRHWRTPILALLAIAGFAVCFQLPVTTPLWLLLPQFKFILFPYRLLPLLSLGSLLLIYSEGVTRKLRRVAVITLAVFALFPFFSYGRILPSQRFRSIAAAAASWRTGFEGVREYVPVTVPLARAEPPFELLLSRQGPFASASCAPSILASHPDQRILRTTSATPCTLLIRTYYYPFWHAHLENGTSLPIAPTSNGLIQISVPQGSHQVVLSFVPATGTRTIATAISLITAFILLLGSWFTHRRRLLRSLFDLPLPQRRPVNV